MHADAFKFTLKKLKNNLFVVNKNQMKMPLKSLENYTALSAYYLPIASYSFLVFYKEYRVSYLYN